MHACMVNTQDVNRFYCTLIYMYRANDIVFIMEDRRNGEEVEPFFFP
jgi:hypothetical protein